MTQSTDRETIGAVLGRTPSGVFVLSAGDGQGRETGMLASWVQQASFEPPMLSIAVNGKRYLNDWLAASAKAALSLIAERQHGLLKHFAAGFEPEEDAFEGQTVSRAPSGLPVLAESLGWLEGEIAGTAAAGDHIIYLLKITAGAAIGDLSEVKPMVHVRRNGFRY